MPPEPNLYVYCGQASAEGIRQMLSEREPDAIIILVFPGRREEEPGVVKLAGDCNGRFMAIANHPDAHPGERLEMAMSMLIYHRVTMLTENGMEDQFTGIVDEFEVRLGQAKELRRGLFMTRLSKISARLANLALSGQRQRMEVLPGPFPFPAVICGAGPSLVDSIAHLKACRDRIFVISVGHAFKTLMEHGLKPDMVTEIDPNARNNWHHPYEPGDIPLLAQVGVDPAIPARFRNVLWCGSRDLRERLWFEQAEIPLLEITDGCSVIIPSIDFAYRAGFASVAVVGSDLCFSATGHSHADSKMVLEEDQTEAPGCDGGTVISAPRFLGLRDGLEFYLKNSEAGTLPVYNCSARGVAIRGMTRLALPEWLARFAVTPIQPVFRPAESPRPGQWLQRKMGELDAYIRLTKKLSEAMVPNENQMPPESHAETAEMLELEKRFANHPEWAYQIGNLRRKTDDFLLAPTTMAERHIQNNAAAWKNLRLRFRILFCLGVDFARKLAGAATLTPAKVLPYALTIYEQNTFSLMTALAVRRWHPALGDMLAHPGAAECPIPFVYTHKWENYEKLGRREVDGRVTLLDPPPQFDRSIRSDVTEMLEKLRLQPDDGIVFLAPFGWTYVQEVLEQQPGRPLIVLEPYPRLLRSLVRYTSLILRLPWQAAVFGVDPKLFPDYENLLRRHLDVWREKGIRPRLVMHPRAGGMAEVEEAAERVTELLARQ